MRDENPDRYDTSYLRTRRRALIRGIPASLSEFELRSRLSSVEQSDVMADYGRFCALMGVEPPAHDRRIMAILTAAGGFDE